MWNSKLFIYGLLSLLSNSVNFVFSQLTLKASAPVNPIENGGILSLHCQIKELPKGHRVEIYRRISDHDEPLSVGDDVASDVGDRVFLAVRYMGDGSVVYFLSITDITNEDGGTYLCKVIRTSGVIGQVAEEHVDINVVYFPSDHYPQCDSSLRNSPGLQIKEGSALKLNCTSEKGNPTVDIKWTKTGGKVLPGNRVIESDYFVYAEAGITVTRRENNAVFLCEITSSGIPGESRTCHIGPITVIKNTKSDVPSNTFPTQDNTYPVISTSELTPFHDFDITGENIRTKTSKNCIDYCASYSDDVFYWIIATAVCVLLGLMFLIFGIGLCLKYKRVSEMIKRTNAGFSSTRLAVDDIYAEVEAKAAIKPYMSLDRARKCDIPTLVPLNRN